MTCEPKNKSIENVEIQDEDEILLSIINERMTHYDLKNTLTQEEMLEYLGLTEDDLNSGEDIEIE